MRLFVLFELFLVLFVFYAISKYEGEVRIVVTLLCLVIAFLLERVRKRRKFFRYNTRLKAQYFLKESDWKECSVLTLARKGMGIAFHTQEKIDIGSTIHLAITAPGEKEPVMIEGRLKWIKQRKNDFVGGIELAEILDADTFVKLS